MPKLRLVIERPPYADFLQGYVGIPANPDVVGSDAAVAGTVVLTTTGSKHVKAHKIEISLVKIESLPGSAAQQQRYKKSIATQVLWSRRGQGDLPKEAELSFRLPIPEDTPPSVQLAPKAGSGVFYQLVAEVDYGAPSMTWLCVSRKPTAVLERLPLTLDRSDLLSTWPVHRSVGESEERSSQDAETGFLLVARRLTTAAGSGDAVHVPVHFRSNRPCTVVQLALLLTEVTTLRPPGSVSSQSTRNVFKKKFEAHHKVEPGENHCFELSEVIPDTHTRMTCNADMLTIAYHIKASATAEVRDGSSSQLQRITVEVDKLPITISTWDRSQAKTIMDRILAARNEVMPPSLRAREHTPQTSPSLPSSSFQTHTLDGSSSFSDPYPTYHKLQRPVSTNVAPTESSFDGARTAVMSDTERPGAPPPSLCIAPATLNPAEQAYHNARMAGKTSTDSAGSSPGRSQLHATAPGSSYNKMIVSNPDQMDQDLTKQPQQRSLELKQEMPQNEKERFRQAEHSVQAAQAAGHSLPAEYHHVADYKQQQHQQVYTGPPRIRRISDMEENPYRPDRAALMEDIAVSQFEEAVAARNAHLQHRFASGEKKGYVSSEFSKSREKTRPPTSPPLPPEKTASREQTFYNEAVSAREEPRSTGKLPVKPVNEIPKDQLDQVSREKAELRQHYTNTEKRQKPIPTPPKAVFRVFDPAALDHAQQPVPTAVGSSTPPLPPGAAPANLKQSQSTAAPSWVPSSSNEDVIHSLYRDPSVKLGKQRAVSLDHRSSWHGDDVREPE